MRNSAVCLLEAAYRRRPQGAALEDEAQCLTYEALRESARRVGAGLLRHSQSSAPVMVYLPKSVGMVQGFYGTLYAGRAYVPTDSAAPKARLGRILSNLRPSAVITNETLSKNLEGLDLGGASVLLIDDLLKSEPDDDAVDRALAGVIDADPIYIMYTSGSTGEPKGVTIPHRGVLHFADWAAETFHWDEDTVIANQAPLYFDVSVMDVYGALRCAGKLILTPEVLFRFPLKLPEFLRDKDVTSIYWVPTVMIRVANSGALDEIKMPKLRTVCFAGEVMPNLQLNVWRRALPQCSFANLYGPTETDVCTAYLVDREFSDQEPLPIGTALPNMRVVLVNEKGDVSDEGEICVSASGILLGYRGNPELTERATLRLELLPGCPQRFYRTGDLGRYNERGELMFLGRKDGQIKLRGNRIELGEVENAGRMIEGVKNACALFDREAQEIVLFAETDEAFAERAFLRAMRKFIPAYMIPSRAVFMPALPHNANDKIDRVKLKQILEETHHE